MTLATVDAQGRPSGRIVLLKGVDAARLRLLHQLRQPQGPRARREPGRRAHLPVEGARAPGAHRGRGREGERGGVRRVLRHPPARLAHRRLGLAAERGDREPRLAGGALDADGRAPRRASRRARRTGAATGCAPTTSSSGRAARAACTTASPTRRARGGWKIANASRPEGRSRAVRPAAPRGRAPQRRGARALAASACSPSTRAATILDLRLRLAHVEPRVRLRRAATWPRCTATTAPSACGRASTAARPSSPGSCSRSSAAGAAAGLAYRLEPDRAREELRALWRREMSLGSYRPRWLRAAAGDEIVRGARLRREPRLLRLRRQARLRDHGRRRSPPRTGKYGSSADYLFRTEAVLAEHGIRDERVRRLAERVRAHLGL